MASVSDETSKQEMELLAKAAEAAAQKALDERRKQTRDVPKQQPPGEREESRLNRQKNQEQQNPPTKPKTEREQRADAFQQKLNKIEDIEKKYVKAIDVTDLEGIVKYKKQLCKEFDMPENSTNTELSRKSQWIKHTLSGEIKKLRQPTKDSVLNKIKVNKERANAINKAMSKTSSLVKGSRSRGLEL